MIFKDELFLIENEGNLFKFKGKIDINDYNKMTEFLIEVCDSKKNQSIIIDFTNVAYINSKGIRSIVNFIFQISNHIKIIIDNSKEWQNVGITPLIKIRPEGEIIIEHMNKNNL